MIIQSKYTKVFQSKNITRQKYAELYSLLYLLENIKILCHIM